MHKLRRSWPALVTMLVLVATLPWVDAGARAVDCNASGLDQWLPDRDVERSRYESFVGHFGTDDTVVVAWPGCTLEDPRLNVLAGALAARRPAAGQGEPLFDRAVTGRDVLIRLTSEPLDLPRETAVDRLRGFLIGPDRESTCALIRLTDYGRANQRAAIEAIREVAVDKCGIAAGDLRLGGTAYEAAVMSEESQRTLNDYTLPVTLVTLAVAWWCLGSLRLLIAVGIAGAYSRFMTMAVVHYTGSQFSAVLIVAPVLVYVLTISGSVHLVNYYRDTVRVGGAQGAAWRALGLGWQPCTLAAVSTSLGLVSLGVSQIAPIREFGYYAAACLMLALGVMLAAVPSALELWPGNSATPVHDNSQNVGRFRSWLTDRLPRFVISHYVGLLLLCGASIAGLGYGLKYTQTSVQIERMFRPDTELIRNYVWFENHIAPLGTIEMVVRFDDSFELDMLEKYRLVRRIDQSLRRIPQVGSTVSASTFLPRPPSGRGTRVVVRQTVFRRRLESLRPVLEDERLLAADGNDELWRITARVPTLHVDDYGVLAAEMMESIDTSLSDLSGASAGVSWSYTGLLPMVETAQRVLLWDLVKSFLFALLLICPVMMLVLRSALAGLLAMIPNVAPIVIIFGGMGWLGYTVDVGSLLTASVALGIAVDDTLHFLKWFRGASTAGMSRRDAIGEAFRRCAPAMVQTTLICGIGLLLLVQSTFIPTQRFVVLLFLLLVTALPGDLVLLPALVASPLGRFFEARPRRGSTGGSRAC